MSTVTDLVLGVDTHADSHACALLDRLGRMKATTTIDSTREGSEQLLAWILERGDVRVAGVEGTASYGAALTRVLRDHDIEVVEVTRGRRQARHRGKNDTIDAQAAARAVLSGDATAMPKAKDGIVESIRVLRLGRQTAVRARTQAAQQVRSLIVSAPHEVRDQLQGLTTKRQIQAALALPDIDGRGPSATTTRTLRRIAQRWVALGDEARETAAELQSLTEQAAPRLLAEPGIGPDSAARLLTTAGDAPDRLRSHNAMAALCGVSPVETSSGKNVRHRLNRGGDRQANCALYTIALNRTRHHPETRAYVARRTAEGRTPREIRRCLMRHLVRRLHPLLSADLRDALALDLT